MKKRWIFWLLLALFTWLVLTRTAEIKQLAKTLAQGRWEWMLVAVLLQVSYFTVLTLSYKAAFSVVGVRSTLRQLLPVTFAALFVNVVAPSGNLSGMALWVDDATRRGQSSARTMAGYLLQMSVDFIAFTLVLAVGMVYLFARHDLQLYEIVGAFVLLLMTTGLSGALALGLWRPALLWRLLSWVQQLANRLAQRLKRPNFLEDDWAEHNANEFIAVSESAARHPVGLTITLGVTLTANLINLTCLYIIFLAFHYPIGLGALVAGYAIGILFWIVSPTPQGIGVVEGVMTLVFISLNVPAGVATAVTLAFRGLSFWIPLLLGSVALRRVSTFSAEQRSLSDAWQVHTVAILTTIMGIINVVSAVTPSLAERVKLLEQFSPLYVRRGGHLTAALAGFALLILARGLWRRKRIAWLATLLVLGISAVSHLVKGLDYEVAVLSIALAIWLWVLRHHFHARSDRPSVEQGGRVLIMALIFTLGYGVSGFYLLDRHYSVNFNFDAALKQTVVMFTQFYDPGLTPVTGFGRYFAVSIYAIGAITFAYAGWLLLRPVFVRHPATRAEMERAETIVRRYGRSSLARLALLNDKSYYFSLGGSVVAYVVKGRVAVTLGDPIGPPQDLPQTISDFRQFCIRNDWQAVFYQTLAETLEAYRQQDFDALCVGQEGIVDLKTFTLEGRANKALRNSCTHMTKAGYQVRIHQPPLAADLLDELRQVSDEWLTMMHGAEKSFSLGWFDDDYICSNPVGVVRAPDGWMTAFAVILSEYQRDEMAVDLMRRRRAAEPGTMDFLFVSLFQWAREGGCETFNLGLSALAGIGEHPEDPTVERVLHFVYEHVNQFYNFKGLHEFKDKYHPLWSPRYLIYPGAASLPAAWLAVVKANSGDEPLLLEYLKRRG
jgi:phosphatidylglycerol lysyltransferase